MDALVGKIVRRILQLNIKDSVPGKLKKVKCMFYTVKSLADYTSHCLVMYFLMSPLPQHARAQRLQSLCQVAIFIVHLGLIFKGVRIIAMPL